jgi:predicted transcriptional regulator of viral defense system
MPRPVSDLPEDLPGHFRSRDADRAGVSRHTLRRWERLGRIEKMGRGLYRRAEVPYTELESIAIVAAAVPDGVVCLVSALEIHEIGTQAPRDVWIAINRKARRPTVPVVRLHVVRFAPKLLRQGVEMRMVHGVSIRVTSPARTVADCFRYRNKVGLDVALEALKDAIRSRKATFREIDHAADVAGVKGVMRPYLELLAS